MDSNTIMLIAGLAVLFILSAYFSACETAFSSLNRIRLKNLANNGNQRAKKTLQLEERYDQLLSTILIGNNIVNIAAASISTVLFVGYFGDLGVTLATGVTTILVLIFGEISPKSIAKELPETYAMFATPSLSVLVWIMTPLNFFFSVWKKMLAKVFKLHNDDSMTQEELMTIVEEAQNDGDLSEHEGDLISAAIEFNDLDVNDILTPRVDIISIDLKMSLKEVEELFRYNRFSRLPVLDGNIDNIIGMIHEKDFYSLYYNKTGNLESIVQEIVYTSPTMKISSLLRQLQSNKTHMAVVIDEYGGTAGIITLEDILEELVGEIWDEHDEVIEYYHQIEDNKFLVSCEANLEDMFEYFDLDVSEDYEFNTVGGWVIHELEKMPLVGDVFVYENLMITIMKIDSRKVLEIQVQVLEDKEDKEDENESKKNKSKIMHLPLF